MKRFRTVDEFVAASDQWSVELAKIRDILVRTELKEELKWGAPCYTYNGKNVVGMASFKSYFGLWFHQGALLKDDENVLINAQEGTTKAQRQWRMKSGKEIKAGIIRRYVREAIGLVKSGRSIAPQRKSRVVVPPELKRALGKSTTARQKFAALTPGRQREYAEYIASAKREGTKQLRLEKILPMITAGIGLNDKYRSP